MLANGLLGTAVIQYPLMDWELRLRAARQSVCSSITHEKDDIPEVGDSFAHHPSVNEQIYAVVLPERLLEREGQERVDAGGEVEFKGRHEEPDACGYAGEAHGQVARRP